MSERKKKKEWIKKWKQKIKQVQWHEWTDRTEEKKTFLQQYNSHTHTKNVWKIIIRAHTHTHTSIPSTPLFFWLPRLHYNFFYYLFSLQQRIFLFRIQWKIDEKFKIRNSNWNPSRKNLWKTCEKHLEIEENPVKNYKICCV